MDAGDVFRQGLGSVIPRPPVNFQHHSPPRKQPNHQRDDVSESDSSSHRIAHTLTACSRCRQRKTRCDPTLPRCLPCERSGSTCEYWDTTKGKKISRFYVVKLQEKVRQLEAELSQYTDEDNEFPRSAEDMMRPGGLVRLNETDETPRYLGPSSGIAMTRLLMEQAKRYTDSQRISQLIPEVRARRMDRANRMQSIVSLGGSISGPAGAASRKKSYPMISAVPAQQLPTRQITDKLVDVFYQRAQFFTPTLHETVFAQDLQAVYDGNTDPYKNFVVRMVLAISLQKLDTQYAGLADSYYLAAMQYFEDVIRPKNLDTLQCLILIGLYSLLTPTRTAAYFIVGLATRISQQIGLADEKTISAGYSMGLVDPLTMDMRRRMAWIVASNELGLAHTMGRPNGFAKSDDFMDVKFFDTVDDENITKEGIKPGPASEKKLVAIHFCKMRLCQAEIRRVLYEKKRAEPRDENSPLFLEMEQKIQTWLDSAPENPAWCKPWFTGRFHGMRIFINRPNPQIAKPSSRSALKCYESAVYIINLSSQQVKKAAVDITWVFLITLNMAVNTLLWTVSYREVREAHPREEVEEFVNISLDIIDQCSERWPGTQNASQLYSIFGKACLQSYDVKDEPIESSIRSNFASSPSLADTNSPSASENSIPTTISSQSQQQPPRFNAPQFGYVFDATPEQMSTFNFDDDAFQHPTFRSNSIFLNPSTEPTGRRFSYFPPDFTQPGDSPLIEEPTPPATSTPHTTTQSPPAVTPLAHQLPTPPESLIVPGPTNPNLSPPVSMGPRHDGSPAPSMPHTSPVPMNMGVHPGHPMNLKFEPSETPKTQPTPQHTPQQPQRGRGFAVPPLPPHVTSGVPQQRPLPPSTVSDWFSPPPPFISPYAFGGVGSGPGFWDNTSTSNPSAAFSGLGLTNGSYGNNTPNVGGFNGSGMQQYDFPMDRQGSLTQEQQMELMSVLETEGMGEINSFLNMDMGLSSEGLDGRVRWT